MTDDDLRARERRWRATGDPADGRAWVAALARVGVDRAALEAAGREVDLAALAVTPLHRAARAGDARAVDRLLAAGTPPDVADALGWTALLHACAGAAPDGDALACAERLLAAGADVGAEAVDRVGALEAAARARRAGLARRLLAAGADPHRLWAPWGPIWTAADQADVETFEVLADGHRVPDDLAALFLLRAYAAGGREVRLAVRGQTRRELLGDDSWDEPDVFVVGAAPALPPRLPLAVAAACREVPPGPGRPEPALAVGDRVLLVTESPRSAGRDGPCFVPRFAWPHWTSADVQALLHDEVPAPSRALVAGALARAQAVGDADLVRVLLERGARPAPGADPRHDAARRGDPALRALWRAYDDALAALVAARGLVPPGRLRRFTARDDVRHGLAGRLARAHAASPEALDDLAQALDLRGRL